MNNNTILAIVFLMAGTLLTTAVTMVPAAYADNKNKAEDESAAALADCDENEVERAGFDCIAVAEIGVSFIPEPEPEPEPRTCEECLEEFLTQEQIETVGRFMGGDPELSTEEVCDILDTNAQDRPLSSFINLLIQFGLSEDDRNDLLDCLADAGIVFQS